MPKPDDKPEEENEAEEAAMTIYRNSYSPSILAEWPEPKRKPGFTPEDGNYEINEDEEPPPPKKVLKKTKDDNNDENLRFDTTHVGWTGRVNYAIEEIQDEKSRNQANTYEPYRDANHLLEVTISTVILMAMGATVPEENYIYTSLYLQNIRDDFGDYPPNIAKILHLIRKAIKDNNIDWGAEIEQSMIKPDIEVTRFTNKSKIPVRQKKSLSDEAETDATKT